MTKVAIVTDSTASMPQYILAPYPDVHVIPQTLIWGNETWLDGVDIQPDEFYARLQHATVMPSSSQATPKTFVEVFKKLLDQGQDVLSIVLSADLSGTLSSATQAKEAIPEASIEVIDARTTAMAMGFLVLEAARAAQKGASLAECKRLVESLIPKTGVFFTVDTLEYLHHGGRIGGVTRYLGTALNIKPIIEMVNGRLEPVEKVRTRSKAVNRLVELLKERTGGDKPLYVSCLHANVADEAQALLERLKGQFNILEGSISPVSPVVGVHVGPGTLGITYMVRD